MFSAQTRGTVYSRCESLLNGTVGVSLTALKEAFYGEYSDRLLLIDYDLLTKFPENTLKLFYKFLKVEYLIMTLEMLDMLTMSSIIY